MKSYIFISLVIIFAYVCTYVADCAPANNTAPAQLSNNGNSSIILGALTNSTNGNGNATEVRGSKALLGYGVGLTVGPQNVPVGPGIGASCYPPYVTGFPPAHCYTGYNSLGLGGLYGYPYPYYLG